jgi:hypothetical protein
LATTIRDQQQKPDHQQASHVLFDLTPSQ